MHMLRCLTESCHVKQKNLPTQDIVWQSSFYKVIFANKSLKTVELVAAVFNIAFLIYNQISETLQQALIGQ